MLLKFLPQLQDLAEDALIQELVIKSLQCCPDLVQPFFSALQVSLTPRASVQWMNGINLVTKVGPDEEWGDEFRGEVHVYQLFLSLCCMLSSDATPVATVPIIDSCM